MSFKLSDKAYNFLKSIALIWFPAFITLVSTFAAIWGIPYAEQILATLVAVNTFMGVVLGVSNANYLKTGTDGTLKIDSTSKASTDKYRLDITAALDSLPNKKYLILKIDPSANLSQEKPTL